MQKGVFTTWIKELCALVFVQTIQAFILAIVLSIILTFIKEIGSTISNQAIVSALGVLCIVLLTSLTKMEQITKKIFGLDSGILQNKPPHGLMASYMALKAAGRMFNNIPKIASGFSGLVGARTDKKKVQARFNNKRNNMLGGTSGAGDAPGAGGGSGAGGGAGSGSDDDSLESLTGGGAVGSLGGGATPQFRNGYKQKDLDALEDKYEEQLAAIKKQRKEARNKILSGTLETGGAITGAFGGAAVGLTSGLATGDLDQIPKAIGYGIGAGDAVGEATANAIRIPGNIKSAIQSNVKAGKDLRSSQDKLIETLGDAYKGQKEGRTRKAIQQKQIDDAIKKITSVGDI